MSSTPAMKVLDTAPIPGSRMPSFPLAGRIVLFVIRPPEIPQAMISKTAPRHGRAFARRAAMSRTMSRGMAGAKFPPAPRIASAMVRELRMASSVASSVAS